MKANMFFRLFYDCTAATAQLNLSLTFQMSRHCYICVWAQTQWSEPLWRNYSSTQPSENSALLRRTFLPSTSFWQSGPRLAEESMLLLEWLHCIYVTDDTVPGQHGGAVISTSQQEGPGFDLDQGLSVVLPVSEWVSSGYSGFHPQSNMRDEWYCPVWINVTFFDLLNFK